MKNLNLLICITFLSCIVTIYIYNIIHNMYNIPAVSFALPPQTISTGTVTTVPSPASTDTAAAYVRLHAMAIGLL